MAPALTTQCPAAVCSANLMSTSRKQTFLSQCFPDTVNILTSQDLTWLTIISKSYFTTACSHLRGKNKKTELEPPCLNALTTNFTHQYQLTHHDTCYMSSVALKISENNPDDVIVMSSGLSAWVWTLEGQDYKLGGFKCESCIVGYVWVALWEMQYPVFLELDPRSEYLSLCYISFHHSCFDLFSCTCANFMFFFTL